MFGPVLFPWPTSGFMFSLFWKYILRKKYLKNKQWRKIKFYACLLQCCLTSDSEKSGSFIFTIINREKPNGNTLKC